MGEGELPAWGGVRLSRTGGTRTQFSLRGEEGDVLLIHGEGEERASPTDRLYFQVERHAISKM